MGIQNDITEERMQKVVDARDAEIVKLRAALKKVMINWHECEAMDFAQELMDMAGITDEEWE